MTELELIGERAAALERRLRLDRQAGTEPRLQELALRTLPVAFYDLAANKTLDVTELGFVHVVNCTSASSISLPLTGGDAWILVVNRGSATITLKDAGGSTLGTVAAGASGGAYQDATGTGTATA
jgi:hypothetical protein